MITAEGRGRRRRALRWSAGTIVVLGMVLDFVRAPDAAIPWLQRAVRCEPVSAVPAGRARERPSRGTAVLRDGSGGHGARVRLCGRALAQRSTTQKRSAGSRFDTVLPRLVIVAAAAAVTALVIWRVNEHFPTYFAFLSAGAVIPAMFLYRTIGTLVNWPAFAVTVLYVLVTSLIWEVTLAIPRQWWNYEPSGMIGLTIAAWSRGDAIFCSRGRRRMAVRAVLDDFDLSVRQSADTSSARDHGCPVWAQGAGPEVKCRERTRHGGRTRRIEVLVIG